MSEQRVIKVWVDSYLAREDDDSDGPWTEWGVLLANGNQIEGAAGCTLQDAFKAILADIADSLPPAPAAPAAPADIDPDDGHDSMTL